MTHLEVAICRMIAFRTRQGDSLNRISADVNIAKSELLRLAQSADLRYVNKRPSHDLIKLVVNDVVRGGLNFRAAARRRGLSKSAVHRFVQTVRELEVDRAGPQRFANRQQVCPEHGPVTVWPCVACTALHFRGNARQFSTN